MVDRIEHLLQVGRPGGPSLPEALGAFAALRSTPDEGRALRRLLARHASVPLPEPLLIAVASALGDRGERSAAIAALTGAASLPALMLHADLLERAGELAGALELVERVLLRDIDWPGASERRRRWAGAATAATSVMSVASVTSAHAPDGAIAAWAGPEGPFRRLREAARGGTAVVYEAEDRELGRRVALKVYHRPERDRAQLLHEARVAVALAGEGIVPVLDVDADEGWLAMPWARLGALRGVLADPGEPAARAPGRWALPLARALARVHAAGWVHHDVKPANVLLRAADQPLLADFGSARRAREPASPGSFGYVSPERSQGRASDPRDDVYGFGRIVEDALDADVASRAPRAPQEASWRVLARACAGPDAERPRDGTELIVLIERAGLARS